MKIAIILPSNLRCAPNAVARLLYDSLISNGFMVSIYVLNRYSVGDLHFSPDYCVKLNLKNATQLNSFDVLHSMGFKPDYCVFLLKKLFILNKNIPLITTIHSDIKTDLIDIYGLWAGYFFSALWHIPLKFSDVRIHINNSSRKYYLNKYNHKGRDVCIPNAIIPIPTFCNANINDLLTADCLFVGKIRPIKGVMTIINTLSLNSEIKVDVYGDFVNKKYRDFICSEVRKRSLDKSIRFMGHVENITEIYANYKLLIVPSLSEGFGLVILEAIMSGIYVICNDIPSLRSLYDRHPVIFYRQNDCRDLEMKISSALRLPCPSRDEIEYYINKFSTLSFFRSHVDVYRGVIN
jgi:glycosyltransferase involved in cell wall biosynthesis